MSNGDIEELLKKYGARVEPRKEPTTADVLADIFKKRKAAKPETAIPKAPEIFSASELKEFGFDLQEDWMLKLAPNGTEAGFAQTLISPQGEEMPFEDVFKSPEGKWVTRAEMEALYAPAVGIEPELDELVTSFSQVVANIAGLEERLAVAIGPPERDRLEMELRAATAEFEEFFQGLIETGRTGETEVFLRALGATEQEIEEFFAPREGIGVIPPEGLPFPVVTETGEEIEMLLKPENTVWYEGKEVASWNPETGEITLKEVSYPWWQRIMGFGAKYMPTEEWLPKVVAGMEYVLYPFTSYGMKGKEAVEESALEAGLFYGLPAIWAIKEGITRIAELITGTPEEKAEAQEEARKHLIGGEYYEQYRDQPWYQQLLYEAPMWAATSFAGAAEIRAALMPAAVKGGIRAVPAITARGVLLPAELAEKGVAITLKYGIGIPLKYVVVKAPQAVVKKSFDLALNQGLDKWLVRQGLNPDQANKVIAYFLKRNEYKLFEYAKQNLLKRVHPGSTGATAERAAQQAADDTIKQVETLLLKAMEETGVKPITTKPMVTPPPELAGVPTTITKAMEGQLVRMGYSVSDIAKMTPEVAWNMLYKPVPEVKPVAPEVAAEIEQLYKMESLAEQYQRTPSVAEYYFGKKTLPEKITIWRATTGNEIIPGDYVSADKAFAELHMRGEGYKLVNKEVSPRDLRIAGTSAGKGKTEFYYAPEVAIPKAEPGMPEVKPPVVSELKDLYSQISTEVRAFQVAIKGLTGDEVKIARETLKGVERELKYVENTLASFKKRPDIPDATVLRSTIMAWAKYKGLTKTALQQIYSSVAGRRQLTKIPQEQLLEVMAKVKAARPKMIRHKTVITPKTEKKIQTLKDTLIANRQMTEKSFDRLLERLGLSTTKYESQYRYITEVEGKALIRAMNDEVLLAEWDIKIQEGLTKHPEIKERWDGIKKREVAGVNIQGESISIARGHELRSMRYYVMKLQKEMDAPIYDIWQKINMAHLAIRKKRLILGNKLRESTPEYKAIATDEKALKRIEDYIASEHKMGPKKPTDITSEEIKLAEELERQLFEWRNDIRYARFREAYSGHGGNLDLIAEEIPDAPKAALRRALDILEGKGDKALKVFLDTQKWGVIKTGYSPLSVIKPRLHLYKTKPTAFAKGHIQTREGIEYREQERNILSRYSSYTKQITGLTDLAPLIRVFDRVFTEHAHKLAEYRQVANVLSRGINEMKGYHEEGGFFVHIIERLYAQVASAVFWRPDLVLRNKFQNWAFNPDFHAGLFLHRIGNKPISPQRRLWSEIFVYQEKGIIQDLMFRQYKPVPGFGRFVRLANKTSLFPWSDKSNRAEAFWVRINRVDRALKQYEKDGNLDKLIKNSGLIDLEPIQQREALELLSMDTVDYGVEGVTVVTGKEAFARYNAQQLTNNVHFLYDRAQRAPAEMGATGKVLGNIFVFQRSWGERFVLQANKLRAGSGASWAEKRYALKTILGMIVAGYLAGETYKKITGKKHNPYNPINILSYTPGGLMLGVTEDISNIMYLITEAAQGNEYAQSQIPGAIAGVADICLPFYKNLMQAIEAVADKKYIDILAMKEIRGLIDHEYEVRGGTHEVERNLIEKLQHAFLAGEVEPPTIQEKIRDAEELLGQAIEEEDKPFSIEDPDIYDMGKHNSFLGQLLRDVPLEDITKENGYSEYTVAWAEKETSVAIYETLPNVPLYKINADPAVGDTFEEYYEQWRLPEDIRADYDKAYLGNFSKRQLELLRQYHSLEGVAQTEFLDEHPELKLDPRDEWLKAHPEDNAKLALWGQAKLLTMESYDLMQKMIKELDIPDSAMPELTLPPKGSVENYFEYKEKGEEFGYNSAEIKLILAEDDVLREWLGREPIDTPIEALNLTVKWRELNDLRDAWGDRDSPLYIEDDDARQEAYDKQYENNPQFRDDMRRVEAYSLGFGEAPITSLIPYPTDSTTLDISGAIAHMEWAKQGHIPVEGVVIDEWNQKWLDNYDFIITVLNDLRQGKVNQGNIEKAINILREDIRFDEPPEGWDAWVKREVAEGRISQKDIDTGKVVSIHWEMVKGYKGTINMLSGYLPTMPNLIESYVEYFNFPVKGFEQERYLVEHGGQDPDNLTGFAKAMHELKGIDIPRPETIPSVQYDDIYEEFQEDFEKIAGFSDFKSPYYIEYPEPGLTLDETRDKARNALRFTKLGNPTPFFEAEKRREAYGKLLPEKQIEDYVSYHVILNMPTEKKDTFDDMWFEDDWFLMEHPDFEQVMVQLYIDTDGADGWKEMRDFTLVPSRTVWREYKHYKTKVPEGEGRIWYRCKHKTLDAWLVLAKDYKPVYGTDRCKGF